MEPTPDNWDIVINAPPALLNVVIPKVLRKLRDPNVPTRFASQYIGALRTTWMRQCAPFLGGDGGGKGWTSLQETCFRHGIVETMSKFCQLKRYDSEIASWTYLSMETISHLARAATMPDKRRLFDQVMEHGWMKIVMDKFENHHLCIHRTGAMSFMRYLCAELFLAERLSAEETADIIDRLCNYTLKGPEQTVRELYDPKLTWQSQMMQGQRVERRIASKYGHRWYAMSQDHAMFCVNALLMQGPVPDRGYALRIIQLKPEILDKLMQIAMSPRPPWYPETEIDSLAMECIAQLTQFPVKSIPGFHLPGGEHFEESEVAFSQSIEAIGIFLNRPNWVSNILQCWKNIEVQTYADVKRMVECLGADYHAIIPGDMSTLKQAFEHRSQLRISILRVISHATYHPSVKPTDLLPFLRLAYLTSQKVRDLSSTRPSSEEQIMGRVERSEEIFRKPMWALINKIIREYAHFVPPETVLGPITLVRLYTRLAECGMMKDAQGWTVLPDGTHPSTKLDQVQQALSQEVVTRALVLSTGRLEPRRADGKRMLERDNDMYWTRGIYVSVAELAQVLITFTSLPGHAKKYKEHIVGAHKELALSLGNAAEMSLRLKEWVPGLGFAFLAEAAAREAPSSDGLDPSVLAKNQRRVANALDHLDP